MGCSRYFKLAVLSPLISNSAKYLYTYLYIIKVYNLHSVILLFCRAGDFNLHHVCAYVRACVHACVTQFPLKLLQLHIFGKLVVLMNFFALQYFLGLVNFGLLVSE